MKKGNKKTAEKHQPEPKQEPSVLTVITNDAAKFEVDPIFFSKYSNFIKYMMENDQISLSSISSDAFKYALEFLENRKTCEPKEIPVPLNNNKNFDSMVEKCDADLVNKIFSEGYPVYERTLNAASFLQMQSFLKLLYARLAMQFIGKDIDILKKEFGVGDCVVDEEEAINDLKGYLQLHRP